MEQVRSFIGINLPEKVKIGLARLQDQLKSGEISSVKWVEPSDIHLTLKFLGSVTVDKIDEITRALEKATQGIPPFQLKVKELGAFPDLRRVQVVWVGLNGEIDKISQLKQHIESNLLPLGFTPESRPFTPHLTLARLRDRAASDERQRLGQLIAGTTFEVVYTIKVDYIHLMKSQLTREGAIYSKISSIGLKKPLSTNLV